jgi:hypothetical protein
MSAGSAYQACPVARCFVAVGVFSSVIATSLSSTALAQAIETPSYLRGKSFELNWSRSMTFKIMEGAEAGQQITKVQSLSAKIYVSNKGRIFSSFQNTDNYITNDVQGSGENAMFWKYDSGAIVGDQAFLKGMRRIRVSSIDKFKTCALNVIFGRLNGNQPLIVKGSRASDPVSEIVDFQFHSKTCQVRQGNVFDDKDL